MVLVMTVASGGKEVDDCNSDTVIVEAVERWW